MTQHVTYTVQWSDPRLATSPCGGKLDSILSLRRDEVQSPVALPLKLHYRSLYWLPALEVNNLVPGFDPVDSQADFRLNAAGGVRGAGVQGTGTRCEEGCVTYRGEVTLEVVEPFRYYYFPFDNQTIVIELVFEGSEISNCEGRGEGRGILSQMGLTEENVQGRLMPSESEWFIQGALDAAITSEHPIGRDGARMLDHCRVSIRVRRNTLVFVVKSMSMTILVVWGGLLALWLSPHSFLGERTEWLLLALLLVMTNIMGSDLGIGKLNYLIWVDYFQLLQLAVLLLALFETLGLHCLLCKRHEYIAMYIDHSFRVFVPFCLYPVATAAAILYGRQQSSAATLLLILGFALIACLAVCSLVNTSMEGKRQRQRVILRIQLAWASISAIGQQAAVGTQEAVHADVNLLRDLFNAFDRGALLGLDPWTPLGYGPSLPLLLL